MRQSAQKVLFFLLLLFSTAAYGGERYSVRLLDQGTMYFFMPCKIKGDSGNRLQYDMTLISYRDSVSINMTLTSPLGHVKSVRLQSGDSNYSTTQYELYYQERKGSRFNTRVHIDCPMDIYKRLFAGNVPLTIEFTMEDGKQYVFTYKEKVWRKDSGYVTEVLEMISYSKKR